MTGLALTFFAQGNKGPWNNPGFWEQAWQQEWQDSLYGRQCPERSGPKWWDLRAAHFAAQTTGEEGRRRANGVVSTLEQYDGLHPDAEVLDIGCGPGNLALPLARKVKKVVALDPSKEMLTILQERAIAEGITNIETHCLTWEETILSKMEWQNRFDVVLAAMSPGIHDVPTLQKMLAASKNVCFFSSFAQRKEPVQQELWRRFLNEEMPSIPADAFYILHLLYAWGYLPSLKLIRRHICREQHPAEAAEELLASLIPFREVTSQLQEEVSQLVAGMTIGGRFVQERIFIEANLTWRVSDSQ